MKNDCRGLSYSRLFKAFFRQPTLKAKKGRPHFGNARTNIVLKLLTLKFCYKN